MNEDMTRAFSVLMCAYPNWNPSAATLEFYAEMLADIPPVDLGMAVMSIARTSVFPPTIAEIRKGCIGRDSLAPEEAWLEIARQVKSEGWCGIPKFSSPDVERAVAAMGGWRSLCSLPTCDMGTARAQFMRCYGAYSKRTTSEIDRKQVAQRSGGALTDGDRTDLEELHREALARIKEGTDE